MSDIRVVRDGDLYHVYIGGGHDFWMGKMELLELYAAIMPIVKEAGINNLN